MTQRHGRLMALVTLLVVSLTYHAHAGGAWVDSLGRGSIRLGYDWKLQPGALRYDTHGDLYRSLFNMTHDYRFLYAGGEVGLGWRLEASFLVTYLWAREIVDSTAEDPSRIYHGPSDMWLGLKYQIVDGDYPIAVGATVRLPNLYEANSTLNGQLLTEITGLLGHDYEASVYASHSFNSSLYASASLGGRIRDGASANQVLYGADAGYTIPILGDRISVRAGFDGVASVGEPRPSTAKDRFPGLSLERDNHFFDFNDASYFRPQLGMSIRVLPTLEINGGFAYILWAHSSVLYQDFLLQVGYSF
ncbi:MAG: hypothetical protein JST22_07375 [Bacteroidetes bacterium]|nr:hypothetical protein [Bacteroidota bacterium]